MPLDFSSERVVFRSSVILLSYSTFILFFYHFIASFTVQLAKVLFPFILDKFYNFLIPSFSTLLSFLSRFSILTTCDCLWNGAFPQYTDHSPLLQRSLLFHGTYLECILTYFFPHFFYLDCLLSLFLLIIICHILFSNPLYSFYSTLLILFLWLEWLYLLFYNSVSYTN